MEGLDLHGVGNGREILGQAMGEAHRENCDSLT
jgi:hypothetical protein